MNKGASLNFVLSRDSLYIPYLNYLFAHVFRGSEEFFNFRLHLQIEMIFFKIMSFCDNSFNHHITSRGEVFYAYARVDESLSH